MGQVQIRIQELKDASIVLFPEFSNKEVIKTELSAVSILEGGMVSGKTSVGLFATHNGKVIFIEVGAEMLNGINAAVQGAVARFGN